jgi:hypothetical protein
MALKTRKPTGAVPWPLVLIEGEEKAGKAQPLNARIATPSGWTTMGELNVGSRIIGSDGRPTTVTAIYERGERDIYRLTFSDGAEVEACDERPSLHVQQGPEEGPAQLQAAGHPHHGRASREGAQRHRRAHPNDGSGAV